MRNGLPDMEFEAGGAMDGYRWRFRRDGGEWSPWYRPESLTAVYRLGVKDGLARAAGRLDARAKKIREATEALRELLEEDEAAPASLGGAR